MNKLEYLKTCKTFLRKVVNYRRNLNRMNCGKRMTYNMVKTIFEIDFYMPTFTFDSIFKFLCRVQVRQDIIELIPTNKTAWIEELDELIHIGFKLRYEEGIKQEAAV